MEAQQKQLSGNRRIRYRRFGGAKLAGCRETGPLSNVLNVPPAYQKAIRSKLGATPTFNSGATTGGGGVAARTVSALQSLFAHAARFEIIASNPAAGVRKLAGKKKERRLSVAEIKKLGAAMHAAEQSGEHPVGLAAVHMMLLTGFRISETQGLQKAWLRVEQGYVHFPDTKSDGQIRAIGPAAAELAANQPGRKNSPYVFPADFGDGHFTAAKRCLARLCALAKIEGITPLNRAGFAGGSNS